MKKYDSYMLGTGALLLAGVLGGLGALGSKIILRELPPLTVLFLRLTIMLTVLLPLVRKNVSHIWMHKRKIVLLGCLLAGNLVFFILGIGQSTAISSSLLYDLVPLLVLIFSYLFFRTKIARVGLVGLGFALAGAIVVIADPHKTTLGFGTMLGNITILCAVVSYSLYLVYSKKIVEHISPLVLTTGVALVAWGISGIVMLVLDGGTSLALVPSLTLGGWGALLYLGVILGAVMYLLTQWGIKRGSTLVAASNGYVSTFVAVISGILFLGEQLTLQLFLGGALLLIGIYFISIYPLISSSK